MWSWKRLLARRWEGIRITANGSAFVSETKERGEKRKFL